MPCTSDDLRVSLRAAGPCSSSIEGMVFHTRVVRTESARQHSEVFSMCPCFELFAQKVNLNSIREVE